MLQLDKDQECFDFLKWYATDAERDDYDWGDMSQPFLNVKNTNALDDVQFLLHERAKLPHTSAALLLKLKLLLDIINIRLTRSVLAGRLPPELWKRVELDAVRSPISRQWAGKSDQLQAMLQMKLENHIIPLSDIISDINQPLFRAIMDPDMFLALSPEHYSEGSFEELVRLMQHSYPAWWQQEGAIELLSSAKSLQ